MKTHLIQVLLMKVRNLEGHKECIEKLYREVNISLTCI